MCIDIMFCAVNVLASLLFIILIRKSALPLPMAIFTGRASGRLSMVLMLSGPAHCFAASPSVSIFGEFDYFRV